VDNVLWQSGLVQPDEPTREELQATIAQLRQELEVLREEIRRIRQDRYEVPPHY
jgi:prefoldin subunit 5